MLYLIHEGLDPQAYKHRPGTSDSERILFLIDSIISGQDFFQKECWAHHPKPYAEFMEWRKKEDERWEMERGRLVPGM